MPRSPRRSVRTTHNIFNIRKTHILRVWVYVLLNIKKINFTRLIIRGWLRACVVYYSDRCTVSMRVWSSFPIIGSEYTHLCTANMSVRFIFTFPFFGIFICEIFHLYLDFCVCCTLVVFFEKRAGHVRCRSDGSRSRCCWPKRCTSMSLAHSMC